jgi:excinuclease ABC subunit C
MINETILKEAPTQPGVYQMFNRNNVLIYVGKASNLKKRLSSYFQKNITLKTKRLMSQVGYIKTTITQNEYEALLLESKLIKKNHPRYNILLRDDKSYPYLYLSTEDKFPRIVLYRGKKEMKGLFFGPYPNVSIVRNIVNLLQKVFKIRTCTNSFFFNRTRPCLQYQINRCTAPCVGHVTERAYQSQIAQVKLFLEGNVTHLIQMFRCRMQEASEKLDYEEATYYRDCIHTLEDFHMQQVITRTNDFVDILGFSSMSNTVALSVLSIRAGELFGNEDFTVELPMPMEKNDILQTLLMQYYEQLTQKKYRWPKQILLPFVVSSQGLVEKALGGMANKKIKLVTRCLARYRAWQSVSQKNSEQALQNALNRKNVFISKKFVALKKACGLEILTTICCFDVSHTRGKATVASCVVFNSEGPVKDQYRKFTIHNINAGDDYAAIAQAVERHFKKLVYLKSPVPQLVIVDGGIGQLHAAQRILKALNLNVLLLGIAKGQKRRAGLERLFLSNQRTIELSPTSPAFHLIQYIRDEAHRFAIQTHRKKLRKKSLHSILEDIPGVGEKRRQLLLKHFGGLNAIKRADINEITKINGISKSIATVVKNHLQSS